MESSKQVANNECLGNPLLQTFRPLIVSLKILGLYYKGEGASPASNSLSVESYSKEKQPTTNPFQAACLKVYSIVVMVSVWIYTLLRFSVFSEGSGLFGKLSPMIWNFIVCMSTLAMYLACRKNLLQKFFDEWRMLYRDMPCVFCPRFFKRRLLLYTGVGWIIILLNYIYTIHNLFNGSMDNLETQIAPFHLILNHNQTVEIYAVKVFSTIINFYMLGCWIHPVVLFFSLAVAMHKAYQEFNRNLKMEIRKQSGTTDAMTFDLEWHRKRHQQTCRIMEIADDIFSLLTSAWLLLNVVLCCLILYLLVYHLHDEGDIVSILISLSWLMVAFALLGIVAVGGGCVNYQAHASLGDLHEVDLSKNTDTNTLLQMQLFLNKLSGESIGFSASNMFVIDRPTILTVSTMVVTYFIMLVQFQPMMDSSQNGALLADVNCTANGV